MKQSTPDASRPYSRLSGMTSWRPQTARQPRRWQSRKAHEEIDRDGFAAIADPMVDETILRMRDARSCGSGSRCAAGLARRVTGPRMPNHSSDGDHQHNTSYRLPAGQSGSLTPPCPGTQHKRHDKTSDAAPVQDHPVLSSAAGWFWLCFDEFISWPNTTVTAAALGIALLVFRTFPCRGNKALSGASPQPPPTRVNWT